MLNLLGRLRAAGWIRRRSIRAPAGIVSNELAIEVDANGSPINVPAAEWFVCFVPGLKRQWWHLFANARHQHVFAMRMVEDGSWILVEPWWTRMLVSVLTLDEAAKFLRWGATGNILQVREAVPGCGTQLRGWCNCAILIAFLLGRSYRTWTPHGLYLRLAGERGARPVDLAHWLANHVRDLAVRNSDRALPAPEALETRSLRSVLIHLGKGITSATMSRSALGQYRFAISESNRFGAAANAYWESVPRRAIESVRKALQLAQMRGEISIEDPALAARQFVAMLHGDAHLGIVFGSRDCPDATEIQVRVESAVDLLLNGAQAGRSSLIQALTRPGLVGYGSTAGAQLLQLPYHH